MSRNGSGTYNLPSGNPVTTGTTITSNWANTTLSDVANALTGSVASDGQTTMSGNLNMGTNQIKNLATGTLSTDATNVDQVNTAIAAAIATEDALVLKKASNLSDVASASTSRTNLGLGSIATQASSSVSITGGTITGTTISGTAVTANSIANTGGWAVTPSGTTLYFAYNGTNVAKLDSSGNLTVAANVTAYGTI